MLYNSYFKKPKDVPLLLDKIREYSDKTGPIRLMEICGTHTMAIARSGIRRLPGLRYSFKYDRHGP